jgi:hypothetical protein
MTRPYALVNNAGALIRRQAFEEGGQPVLAAAKALRWIEDNPPSFNQATERLVVVEPIPTEAEEVPYTIHALPTPQPTISVRDLNRASARLALADKGPDAALDYLTRA